MSAPAPLPLPSDCPMLRHLSRDTGSQFALFSMLLTKDIASLVMTCRDWSRWINGPNVLGSRHRRVKPSRFDELMRCSWIRRPQHEFRLLLESEQWPDVDDEEAGRQMQTEQQQLEYALAHLGPQFFPSLQDLCIDTRVERIAEPVLRACLLSLGPRLTEFECNLWSNVDADVPRSAIVRSLMSQIGSLPNLLRLSIVAPMLDPASMPFDALPDLKQLDRFDFRSVDQDRSAVTWRPSKQQVACLARCHKLTEIDCGAWDADADLSAEEQETVLQRGIAVLADARRVRLGEDAEAHPPLVYLNLRTTVMSPQLWSHLCRLCDLDDLFPVGWSEDLSAERWEQLSLFSRLNALSITPDEDWALSFQSDNYLPSLLQCTGLQRLRLGSTELSVAQFTLLTSTLKQLEWLDLIRVRFPVECFPLLSSLPLLSHIGLSEYATLAGITVEVRPLVPALAALTQLHIYEAEDAVLTKNDVAADNAALFLRCPLLQADEFEQNTID